MKNIYTFIIIVNLLSGCAATNFKHHIRDSIYYNGIHYIGATSRVKSVALNTENNSIHLCIEGDYYDTKTSYYTLEITEKYKVNYKKNRTNYILYSDLMIGCDIETNKNMKLFSLTERRKSYTQNISPEYNYNYKYELNKKYKLSLSNRTWKNKIIYTEIIFHDNSITTNETKSFFINKISDKDEYENYDSHKYDRAGELIDILTFPIQVPLCIITLGGLCSESPHPNLIKSI